MYFNVLACVSTRVSWNTSSCESLVIVCDVVAVVVLDGVADAD